MKINVLVILLLTLQIQVNKSGKKVLQLAHSDIPVAVFHVCKNTAKQPFLDYNKS